MSNQPIGIFDSGFGGISVLGQAVLMLPNERYLYYGDTLHSPYGDKSPDEVLFYSKKAVDHLIDHGCKAIVMACNTATAVAAQTLRDALSLPIIGMEPALKPASLMQGEGHILVMATELTLSQPKFAMLMAQYGQDAIPVPCSGLMECVEAGDLSGEHVHALLHRFLDPHLHAPIKAIVLGCTHYVFLKKAIDDVVGHDVPFINGNTGTVLQLKRRLDECGLLSTQTLFAPDVVFHSSSDDPALLTQMHSLLTHYLDNKQVQFSMP